MCSRLRRSHERHIVVGLQHDKFNCDNCVLKDNPQPPFKIECAIIQSEQSKATADFQFNIGSYTFTDTFVVLPIFSFPLFDLKIVRNHQAMLDTANGTITFPNVKISIAVT